MQIVTSQFAKYQQTFYTPTTTLFSHTTVMHFQTILTYNLLTL